MSSEQTATVKKVLSTHSVEDSSIQKEESITEESVKTKKIK